MNRIGRDGYKQQRKVMSQKEQDPMFQLKTDIWQEDGKT